jgi:hypothetical protein
VLASGAVLIHALAAVTVMAAISRGEPVGDWVSFYAAGTIIREGNGAHLFDAASQTATQEAIFGRELVVNGYPLPAFVACLFSLFAALSFVQSYWAWFAINTVALVGLGAWAWAELRTRSESLRLLIIVASALSTPVVYVMVLGQVDFFVVGALLGCLALLRRDRPFTAGCVLAIAVAKPHVVAAAVLLLLVKRERRALAGFAAVAVPLLVAPVLAFGPGIVVDQARLIFAYPSSSTDYNVAASMMVNVRGAIVSITGASAPWFWLPPLAVIGLVATGMACRTWRQHPVSASKSWALVLLLPLLYSPHAHIQMLVLFVCAGVLYAAADDDRRRVVRPEHVLLGFVLITSLWLLSIAAVSLLCVVPLAAFALTTWRWPGSDAESSSSHATNSRLAA